MMLKDWGGHYRRAHLRENPFQELSSEFLKNGADMHSRDSNDNTPMARAEAGGHKDVVDLLRSFGARY